jgi:undecaprenyl-diphosphatase
MTVLRRLVEADALVSSRLRLSPERPYLRRIMAFFAHSGDSWFWLAGLGVVWLMSRGTGGWTRIWSATLIIGILGLAALVLMIKFTVRRQRPEGDWGAIYRSTDPHSFPSGHAARAFLLALLTLGFGPYWLGLVLLAWAPLVCLARVAMGVHYLSDVVAGMVVGIIATMILLFILPVLVNWLPFLF